MTKIYKTNETFYVWHGEGNCDNVTSDLRQALHIQVDLIADGHEPVCIRDREGTVVDDFYLRSLRVNVRQVSEVLADSDDDTLAGLYCVQFSAFLRERESLRKEELAEAARGIFHARQGIECLDDFEIEVIDAFGREVQPEGDFTDFSDDDGDVEKLGEPLTVFVDDDVKSIGVVENSHGIASVLIQDVVGDFDVPATVPEWSWVEEHASYKHLKNGELGIWEFVLNLGCEFAGDMGRLAPVIDEARAMGVAYLIIHQGT